MWHMSVASDTFSNNIACQNSGTLKYHRGTKKTMRSGTMKTGSYHRNDVCTSSCHGTL